jgi:hypothetical protein
MDQKHPTFTLVGYIHFIRLSLIIVTILVYQKGRW